MNGDAALDALRDRLLALFRLQRPALAEALADQALARWRAVAPAPTDPSAIADTLQAIARELLDAAPSEAPAVVVDDDEPAFDPTTRKALRACFAKLGTEAAKLILGYYEFGSDGGGPTASARLRRRQQLAARLGLTPDELRDRALAIRAELEACVRARGAGAAT